MATFISAPNGVLPASTEAAYVADKPVDPVNDIDISAITDIGIASVRDGVAYDDANKISLRANQRASDAAAEEAAAAQAASSRITRHAVLQSVKTATTLADLKPIIRALVQELGIDG